MPFSQSSQISSIMGYIENEKPKSVLDVGVGMGQYGFLMRTNLEHFNLYELNGAVARKRDKSEWLITIDGIEGYPDYFTPVHEYSYNTLFEGDALDILPTMQDDTYDLVIAIDILEHLDKEQGFTFLKLMRLKCSGSVIVSTPKDFIEQHIEANPFENHRSHWTEADLASAGYDKVLDHHESWIAISTSK